MTRRSSVRAKAREIYRELAAKEADIKTVTPTPDPSPQGGGEKNDLTAPSLTERVRALYENSAVPVREIAGIAGVTERTIYKYAAKHRWKPRYRRPDFAPVKGAGARFIRRADKGKPVAQGLKATDPAGARRALAASRQAARLSRKAQAEAAEEQRCDRQIAAIECVNEALKNLRVFRAARIAAPPKDHPKGKPWQPRLIDRRIERAFTHVVEAALRRWEALQAEAAAG